MRKYTKELYSEILPSETGMDTGWKEIGFVELACDNDRLFAFRRVANINALWGVDVKEIDAKQVQELFPLCRTDDVLAGFYVSSDGRANPTDATMALAKGARLYGATIVEKCPVQTVVLKDNRVTGVELESGQVVECDAVVNCAGMWARQLGERSNVIIPNQAAEHYYLITEPMDNVDPSWPVIEDASRCVYIRPEAGGLMLGLFETDGYQWMSEKIPNDFSFGEIQPDWDRMAPFVEAAMDRVPAVKDVGIKTLFCGPESFTPDNSPVLGESTARNYFVAAGLNSIGILTGGGVGSIVARWVRDGHAPDDIDVSSVHAVRFHSFQANLEYRRERVGESLGNTYKVHFPDHQPHTCRNAKLSAIHDRLVAANAYFRDVSGWEAPAWYAPPDIEPVVQYESFGRENWFPYWEAEHLACRENVALFDMSFMSKFLVQGHDAGTFLNRLSTANVDGESGWITYTQWLNERGYMEADLTVTKLSKDQFFVVATDTMHNRVLHHMLRRLDRKAHAFVTDVTGRYAQINLQGPRSRELLQQVTSKNLDELEFRQAAEIDIGLARVLCMRITYVGELGYELFVPVEQATHAYDRVVQAGRAFDLKHAGLRALGSLRLEKGYRDYGHDMDNTDTLLECGLGFTCDFEKKIPFIGQEHVLAQKEASKRDGGLHKRLVSVLLRDPQPLMHCGDVLIRNGKRICDLRAASYGHSLRGGCGLAMVEDASEPIRKAYLNDAEWHIEIADRRYPCDVSLTPFYDPKSMRVKV